MSKKKQDSRCCSAARIASQFRTYRAINAVIKTDPLTLRFLDEGANERFLRQQQLEHVISLFSCFQNGLCSLIFIYYDHSNYPEAWDIAIYCRPAFTVSMLLLVVWMRWCAVHSIAWLGTSMQAILAAMVLQVEAIRLIDQLPTEQFSPATIIPFTLLSAGYFLPLAFPKCVAIFFTLALLTSAPEMAGFGVTVNTLNGIVVMLVVAAEASGTSYFKELTARRLFIASGGLENYRRETMSSEASQSQSHARNESTNSSNFDSVKFDLGLMRLEATQFEAEGGSAKDKSSNSNDKDKQRSNSKTATATTTADGKKRATRTESASSLPESVAANGVASSPLSDVEFGSHSVIDSNGTAAIGMSTRCAAGSSANSDAKAAERLAREQQLRQQQLKAAMDDDNIGALPASSAAADQHTGDENNSGKSKAVANGVNGHSKDSDNNSHSSKDKDKDSERERNNLARASVASVASVSSVSSFGVESNANGNGELHKGPDPFSARSRIATAFFPTHDAQTAEFNKWFNKENLLSIRVTAVVLAVTCGLFGIQDYLLLRTVEESSQMLSHLLIRYCYMLPLLFTFAFVTKFQFALRNLQGITMIVMVLAALGTVAHYTTLASNDTAFNIVATVYFNALLRVMMLVCTNLRLRFRYASVTVISLLLATCVWLAARDKNYAIGEFVMFGSAHVMLGLYICNTNQTRMERIHSAEQALRAKNLEARRQETMERELTKNATIGNLGDAASAAVAPTTATAAGNQLHVDVAPSPRESDAMNPISPISQLSPVSPASETDSLASPSANSSSSPTATAAAN